MDFIAIARDGALAITGNSEN